jgi:molybdopterin/thiamine biosynthesis adenylyltransferase
MERSLRWTLPEEVAKVFSYDEAFSRNLGWVTEAEQSVLARKRVAIAGLGGTGGLHVTTLARTGIGALHLADLDTFETVNMNRQAGAFVSTVGKRKIDVMATVAKDINPNVALGLFDQGVNGSNVDAFLDGVDLYIDALDYFAFDARKIVFRRCADKGIPAVTVAPLGMSAALLVFMPGGMTFDEYFALDADAPYEQALRFLVGLSPALLQRTYLADPGRVKLGERAGPSLAAACQLCAGLAGVEALKILLGRGKVLAAPHGLQFDAYRQKLVKTYRPWGAKNPLQRLAMALVTAQLRRRRPALAPTGTAALEPSPTTEGGT